MMILLSFVSVANAGETCSESTSETAQEVVYEVNKDMPKYLQGATITVTQADGKTSTVPAEKFMVVPRKQKTVLGQNKQTSKIVSCTKPSDKKNIVFADARKDFKGLDVTTDGKTAIVESKKGIVPGVNYYRRELLDSPIGAGVGLDSNGTLKGMIGIDF